MFEQGVRKFWRLGPRHRRGAKIYAEFGLPQEQAECPCENITLTGPIFTPIDYLLYLHKYRICNQHPAGIGYFQPVICLLFLNRIGIFIDYIKDIACRKGFNYRALTDQFYL